MQTKSRNKMIDETENKATPAGVIEEDYFFPDYGVTVRAASHEEALEKAKKLADENK